MLTLVLAALMIFPSVILLKQSARILMLGTPADIDTEDVRETLLGIGSPMFTIFTFGKSTT